MSIPSNFFTKHPHFIHLYTYRQLLFVECFSLRESNLDEREREKFQFRWIEDWRGLHFIRMCHKYASDSKLAYICHRQKREYALHLKFKFYSHNVQLQRSINLICDSRKKNISRKKVLSQLPWDSLIRFLPNKKFHLIHCLSPST